MTLRGTISRHGNRASWPEVKLGSILAQRKITGNRPNLPLLGVSLHEGVRTRSENDGRPAASQDLSAYKLVEKSDVIMNRLGKPHGSVGVSALRGITSPAYWVMSVNENAASPRYVHHLLRSHHLVREYGRLGKYMPPNQFDISWEDFRNIEVPLPPLEEQRRIADFLDAETARIDELVRLDRALSARLDEREKAHRDLVMDGLVTEFGEVPLRRLLRKIEQGSSPQCENSAREDPSEWAVLKLSAVKRGHFLPEENKRLPVGTAPERRYEVNPGDLLITRANTPELVGDAAVVTGSSKRLLLPDLIYRITLARGVEAEFIAQVLLSNRVRLLIEATARGSSQSMVKLRGEDIKAWPVPVADLSTQRASVKELWEMSAKVRGLRREVDQRLALLEERRRAVVTAAVTGELDVTTAHGMSSV